MDAVRYRLELEEVPADFFADPDGEWTYEELVAASGFDAEKQTVCIGALTQAFRGHPAGAAVVTTAERDGRYVAIVECGHAMTQTTVSRVA
jgi:hypothetical protein